MPEPARPSRLQHPAMLVYLLGGVLGSAVNLGVTLLVHFGLLQSPLLAIFLGTLANQLLHWVYYSLVFANKEVQVRPTFVNQGIAFVIIAGLSTLLLWAFLELEFSFLTAFVLVLAILSVANSLLVRISTFGSGKLAEVEYRDMDASFYHDQSDPGRVNWFRAWFHRSRFDRLNRFVHEFFRPGMRVADLGCGNCLWNTQSLPVTGVDINDKMMGWAKEHRYLHDARVAADLANTGLPDRYADILVMSETLEHLFDLSEVLAEVRRILKDNGTFLITVPYDFFFSPFFVLFNVSCVWQGYVKGSKYHRYRCGHINHFSKSRLRKTLAAHGFRTTNIRVVNGLTLYAAAVKDPPQEPASRDYLHDCLQIWPTCHALLRAIECRKLSRFTLEAPILDIGCGDGLFAGLLFTEPLEAGVDTDAAEVRKAAVSGVYRTALTGSATVLPFPENSFASVFSNCVLEHIDDLDQALAEIARVLRPDGRLLATVPTPRWESEGPFPGLRRLGLHTISGWLNALLRKLWHHVTLEDEEAWRRRLDKAHLQLEVWQPYMVPRAYAAYARNLPGSIPSFLWRRLTGWWALVPPLRKLLAPWRTRRLRDAYQAEDNVGACAVFLARVRPRKS